MSQFTEGASGAMTGAQYGARFGPIGAAIGGVIGGIAGIGSGRRKKNAARRLKMYTNMAKGIQRHIQRKQMVQEVIAAQSGVAAAGAATGVGQKSSGLQGVRSAVTTEGAANLVTNKRLTQLSEWAGRELGQLQKPTGFDQFMGMFGNAGKVNAGIDDVLGSMKKKDTEVTSTGTGGSSGRSAGSKFGPY